MRILFYTHRFGRDLVGGIERHLWNLAREMARMGCWIDVCTTRRADPVPTGRFGERWINQRLPDYEEISVEGAQHPMQIQRYPVRNPDPITRILGEFYLQKRWEHEERQMEPQEPLPLPKTPRSPLLLTGWHEASYLDVNYQGRWMSKRAAMQLPETHEATLHLTGTASRHVELEWSRLGQTRVVYQGKGDFQINIRLQDHHTPSVGALEVNHTVQRLRDPRALGLWVSQISLSSGGQIRLGPFHVDHRQIRGYDKKAFIETYVQRAMSRPRRFEWFYDQLRGPNSPGMTRYLARTSHLYDWVIAGPLPHSVLTDAVRLRKKRPFRLAGLPLFQIEDDRFYWRHYLEALRDADLNIANSWFANEVFFPIIGGKSMVGGAGVDESLFRKPGINGQRFREKYGFKPDEKIVLSVGRKHPAKMYRTLTKAVNNIQHRVACKLVMIGPDEDGAAIPWPSTKHLGVLSQDDLLDAYDACDLFALMSESESFGIVFVEAWMREKAVIGARNCAAVANLIHDGRTGRLVGRREELEECLIELLRAPEMCKKLGQAGLEQALRSYTWRVIARKVLDTLESKRQQ